MLNQFGELLFLPIEVKYNDNQLGTAVLNSFHIKKLLEDE
jgi:hypothetical protein